MISYDAIKSGEVAVPAAKPKLDANSIPSLIDRASRRLSEAKTSAEVLEAKAAAELALHYAKVTKAANESHADCLRIITRAEIRMASEIDRGQEAGEVAKPGRKKNVPSSDNKATLAELGVSRQRVNEWRKVAEAGEEKVEEAISEALAEGRAPTKADVHRAAGIVKNKPVSDEDHQFSDLMKAWNAAGQGARTRFLAAIESGLTNEVRTDGCCSDAGTLDHQAVNPLAEQRADESSASISPSAAISADTAPVAPSPDPSGAVPIHSPATLAGADGHPSIPSSDALAAGPGESLNSIAKSERAVTNFTALSKADQIRLLRPYCQHADDLEKCGGTGAKHCSTCAKIAAEGGAV